MGSTGSIVPLILSACAVVISTAAFLTRQRQDKRDLFLRIHERLVDPPIQEGRRLLYERVESVEDVANLRCNEPETYQLINRSLAMFDILGMYVQRRYVDRGVALEEWGHAFARCFRRAQPFIEDRYQIQGHSYGWPHLHSFGKDALTWHNERLAGDRVTAERRRRSIDRAATNRNDGHSASGESGAQGTG